MPEYEDIITAQRKIGYPIIQSVWISDDPIHTYAGIGVCGLVCQVLAKGTYTFEDLAIASVNDTITSIIARELNMTSKEVQHYTAGFDSSYLSERPAPWRYDPLTLAESRGFADAEALGLLIDDTCPGCGHVTEEQGELCESCKFQTGEYNDDEG